MPEYTVLAVLSVVATVLLGRFLSVGLFRRLQYWLAMAIVFAFQVPVDGWLTKLSAPIVIYAPEQHLGVRWPWDIPVEDFLFGFSMVTLCLIVWERVKTPAGDETPAGTAGTPDSPHSAENRSRS